MDHERYKQQTPQNNLTVDWKQVFAPNESKPAAPVSSVSRPTNIPVNVRPATAQPVATPAQQSVHVAAPKPVTPPSPIAVKPPVTVPKPIAVEGTSAPAVSIQINIPSLKVPKLDAKKFKVVAKLARSAAVATKPVFGSSYQFVQPHAARAINNAKTAASKLSKKAAIGMGAACLLLLVGLVVSVHVLHAVNTSREVAAAAKVTAANKKALAKPTFTPAVSPAVAAATTAGAGTTKAASSSQFKSSFDGTRDSYSYQDTLLGQTILVSEQPIPTSFSTPSAAVSTVAASLKATTAMQTQFGNAYMATDAKSNAQTIVLATSKLLVFIQSPFTRTTAQWITYINGLQG